jgi:hypothetical protein
VANRQTGFEAVDRYARKRQQRLGDVYGWARIEEFPVKRALLLIAEDAKPDSFPSVIDGVELELRSVGVPQPQAG